MTAPVSRKGFVMPTDTTRLNSRAVLTFLSDTGERLTISIPRAVQMLSDHSATVGMEGIIGTGAVLTSAGAPVSIHAARLIHTERVRLV